jgi:DNA-binding winged helix-turn-helix (wHTH) protein
MRVVFGECEFDSGQRTLLRHGSAVPLSPKAFQLLELLLDRRPEAVAKTELLERLWPETFISDASLHNLVAEIRAALGDAPRAARYIRTVPRYGYAFHGDAQPAPAVIGAKPTHAGPRLVSSRGEWPLFAGSNVVGRDVDCVVRIDSVTLSRRHAQIIVTNGEATVEDLGSKNGTHVNGLPVTQPVALRDGDQIEVGSVTLTYRLVDAAPSTITRRGM